MVGVLAGSQWRDGRTVTLTTVRMGSALSCNSDVMGFISMFGVLLNKKSEQYFEQQLLKNMNMQI